MIKVVPAIIPNTKGQMLEEIVKVSNFADLIQIDISDGAFTPIKTWPYNGRDTDFFDDLKSETAGWPSWEKVDYEVHLMVEFPENVLEDWIKTGVSAVVAHIESTDDFQKIIDICKNNSISIGLALKPSTDIKQIEGFLSQVDFIQVMGSDSLGKHGIPLEEKAVEKIKMLREMYPERIIGIDIGVNAETSEMLVSAGANKLIAGSAILESDNPEMAWEELSQTQ